MQLITGGVRKRIVSRKDYTSKRYGRLVVQSFSHIDKHGKSCWICLCDCGKLTKPLASNTLVTGHTQSCGCKKQETDSSPKNSKDITGQVFGYLTAIEATGKRGRRGGIIWRCVCICGVYKDVLRSNLVNKSTTSCGCRKVSYLHEDVRSAIINLGIEIVDEEHPIDQSVLNVDEKTSTLHIDILIFYRRLIAIECQGRQHYHIIENRGGEKRYKEQVANDARKKKCLQAMNIPLIEVRYDEKNIDQFLREKLSL